MKTKVLFTVMLSVAMSLNLFARPADGQDGVLVAYFSATGTTAKVAKALADATGGRLYAITPAVLYTADDLDWHDRNSRSSREMKDAKARPALKDGVVDLSGIKVVYIGYPIWWGVAPRVVNTFIESNDLKGKVLIPFATSGGSGIGQSVAELREAYPDLQWRDGKLLNRAGAGEIRAWVAGNAAE